MSVQAQRVSVTNSATRLDITTDPMSRFTMLVVNRGSAAVYVGSSTVTTATGVQVDVGGSLSIDMRSGDSSYAIAASGTHACHVLQAGA